MVLLLQRIVRPVSGMPWQEVIHVGCWDQPGNTEGWSPSASEPLETHKLVLVPFALGSHFKAKASTMAPTSGGMLPVDAAAVEEGTVHPHRLHGNIPEAAEG